MMFSGAGGAGAEEGDFVGGNLEAPGYGKRGVHGAAFQVEDLVAGCTVKVVVVFQVRGFVPGCFTGDLDRADLPFLHEAVQCPVDGGHPDAGDLTLSPLVNVLGAERSPGLGDDILDSATLPGGPLHFGSVADPGIPARAEVLRVRRARQADGTCALSLRRFYSG